VAKQNAIVRTNTTDITIEANRETIAYINLKVVMMLEGHVKNKILDIKYSTHDAFLE